MPDERPPEDRWLTYTDAADRLGISTEALRSLARRQQWPRRPANVVGGQSWVLIPADRLPPERSERRATGGLNGQDRRAKTVDEAARPPGNGGREPEDRRSDRQAEIDGERRFNPPEDRRSEDMVAAVRTAVEGVVQPLKDQLGIANQQIEILTAQLGKAHDRADRAEDRVQQTENRVQVAEGRVRDLQEQLIAEMIEHRRIIGMLTEQLEARRSWWPWRR